jgi:hypothetical protein
MSAQRMVRTSQMAVRAARPAGGGAGGVAQTVAAVFVSILGYAGVCLALWRTGARGGDALVVVPRAIDGARAPSWLPPAEVARVNALGNVVRGRSILDPDLTRDLAACYLESPWVSRVIHVRRSYPNRLDVALQIRRPFAAIDRSSGPTVVLDREGVCLPATADPKGLPRLVGAPGAPPAPGRRWEDVRVRDGLRVLARYGSALELPAGKAFVAAEVDVTKWSRPDGRPIVRIVTSTGFAVVWGVDLPGGGATITGPSAAQKCAWLSEAFGGLAGRAGAIEYLSLRQRAGLVVRYRGGTEGDG